MAHIRPACRLSAQDCRDNAEPALAEYVDKFYTVAIARPGSWIRKLKSNGVTNTVMVGRVEKSQIFTPCRILRYLPDWRALKLWYWTLRSSSKQNQTILTALADELAKGGIILRGFHKIL